MYRVQYGEYTCICCGSILSLVKIVFSFVFGYCNVYDNAFETKENKIEIKEKIKPQHI